MKKFVIILALLLTCNVFSILFAQNPQWMHFSGSANISQMVKDGDHLWLLMNNDLTYYSPSTGSYVKYTSAMYPVPVNFVYSMAKDNDGVIWIGTDNGLISKNGTEWNVYNTSNSNIPSNYVNSVLVDHNNVKWLVHEHVISKFDGISWVTLPNPEMLFTYITAVALDQEDNLWISSYSCESISTGFYVGLCKYNGSNWTNIALPWSFEEATPISKIVFNSQNTGWFGTITGLWTYSQGQWELQHPSDMTQDIAIDANDCVWVAGGIGLSHYDGVIWSNYSPQNTPMLNNLISSIMIDNENNKWIGTKNYKGYGELFKFDDLNWSIQNYYSNSQIFNTVSAIAFADNNTKWFATWDGLLKYDDVNWTHYTEENSGLICNLIENIVSDHFGNVWIDYGYDGLGKFDGVNWTHYTYQNSGLHTTNPTSMIVDSDNNLWLTSNSTGMQKYDGTTWTVIDTSNANIPSNSIRQMVIDNQNRKWAIFNIDNGFPLPNMAQIYECNGDQWIRHDIYVPAPTEGSCAFTSLFLDREDNICGIVSSGNFGNNLSQIAQYDGTDWNFYPGSVGYDYRMGIADLTGSFWFYSTYESVEPAATGFWGLTEFNNQHEWIEYPTTSSLIYSIAVDRFNNKWIGGHNRITVYNEGGVVQTNDPVKPIVSSTFNLSNYPNPFNPTTTISFDMKASATVQLQIYNIRGQLVKTLINEKKQAHSYQVSWNGKDENGSHVASGLYFCRIQAGEKTETRKMMLIK